MGGPIGAASVKNFSDSSGKATAHEMLGGAPHSRGKIVLNVAVGR